MFQIVKSLRQLRFSELMDVYAEGNQINGRELYPGLPPQAQVREAEYDFYQYLNDIFFRTKDAFYALLSHERSYVSALRMEPYSDGLLLCALETAPGSRGKGFAQLLIMNTLAYVAKHYATTIYSHVSKTNLVSLAVHQKSGFEIIKNYAVYSDGSVTHNSYTLAYYCKRSET